MSGIFSSFKSKSKLDEIFLSPNNIKSNCSFGSSLMGLSKLILCFLANCFTWLNTLASAIGEEDATPAFPTLEDLVTVEVRPSATTDVQVEVFAALV